jgi:hypothetical protein
VFLQLICNNVELSLTQNTPFRSKQVAVQRFHEIGTHIVTATALLVPAIPLSNHKRVKQEESN